MGAVLLFTTGPMGMPGLWILSWAFSVGGAGFFCIRRACWFLWKIKLHQIYKIIIARFFHFYPNTHIHSCLSHCEVAHITK